LMAYKALDCKRIALPHFSPREQSDCATPTK
jgi:hypothetical protein